MPVTRTWAWAAPRVLARPTPPRATSSPLLETGIAGAHGVIINITSSPDIGLEDVETAAGLITRALIRMRTSSRGTAFDENLSDEMRVTVVYRLRQQECQRPAQRHQQRHGRCPVGAVGSVQQRYRQCSHCCCPCCSGSSPGRSGSCRKARGRGKQRQPLLRRAAGHPEQAEVRLANNKRIVAQRP